MHVVPTKWVDATEGDARRPEYRLKLCGKGQKRSCLTVSGRERSLMGFLECVIILPSADEETWGLRSVGSEDLVVECMLGTPPG